MKPNSTVQSSTSPLSFLAVDFPAHLLLAEGFPHMIASKHGGLLLEATELDRHLQPMCPLGVDIDHPIDRPHPEEDRRLEDMAADRALGTVTWIHIDRARTLDQGLDPGLTLRGREVGLRHGVIKGTDEGIVRCHPEEGGEGEVQAIQVFLATVTGVGAGVEPVIEGERGLLDKVVSTVSPVTGNTDRLITLLGLNEAF